MMREIDLLTEIHQSTQRNYLGRVNDMEYPKHVAAELAKEYGFDYWDGDRRICYGGYRYIEGRWTPVAKALIREYSLTNESRILDVGCGKGYLLYELKRLLPGASVYGIDKSKYALENSKCEVRDYLTHGCATCLPWEDDSFDVVVSITTLHNLHCYDLEKALVEMERVGKQKFLCVESYRSEKEKANLLYWQVTCEAFNTPEEWRWWFKVTGYRGDYSFIFFE